LSAGVGCGGLDAASRHVRRAIMPAGVAGAQPGIIGSSMQHSSPQPVEADVRQFELAGEAIPMRSGMDAATAATAAATLHNLRAVSSGQHLGAGAGAGAAAGAGSDWRGGDMGAASAGASRSAAHQPGTPSAPTPSSSGRPSPDRAAAAAAGGGAPQASTSGPAAFRAVSRIARSPGIRQMAASGQQDPLSVLQRFSAPAARHLPPCILVSSSGKCWPRLRPPLLPRHCRLPSHPAGWSLLAL